MAGFCEHGIEPLNFFKARILFVSVDWFSFIFHIIEVPGSKLRPETDCAD